MQADLYANPSKICQQFNNNKRLFVGLLPPKDIAELIPWSTIYVYLLVPHSKSIRIQQPGGAIIKNNDCLACMTIIDLTAG